MKKITLIAGIAAIATALVELLYHLVPSYGYQFLAYLRFTNLIAMSAIGAFFLLLYTRQKE